MLRTILFLLIFLAINAGAFFLGTQELSKKIVSQLTTDPQRTILNLVDQNAPLEIREHLAEHLPRFYTFEYACRVESYDGKSSAPLIAGSNEHSFTKEMPLLRCPRGLTASFEAGSKLKIHRKLLGKITWELVEGSAFLQASGSDGISLQSNEVAIHLDALYPQFKLIFRASPEALEVLAIDGEFKTKLPGFEVKNQKEIALVSVGAQLEYNKKRVDPGTNVIINKGAVSLPPQITAERDKWLQTVLKQYSAILPRLFVRLFTVNQKNALFAEAIGLENPKCEAQFFPNESESSTAKFNVTLKSNLDLDSIKNSAGLVSTVCTDAKTKLFGVPVRVVAR
jgi:hypothetical protein